MLLVKLFCAQSQLQTTMRKKPFENMVTSIFSFSHNVSYNRNHFCKFKLSSANTSGPEFGHEQKIVAWYRVKSMKSMLSHSSVVDLLWSRSDAIFRCGLHYRERPDRKIALEQLFIMKVWRTLFN